MELNQWGRAWRSSAEITDLDFAPVASAKATWQYHLPRAAGRVAGMKVSERKIAIDELLAAQKDGSLREVFGCGTASVISPVGELAWDGQRLRIHDGKIGDETMVFGDGQPGPNTLKLRQALTDIQLGAAPDPYGWRTPVEG